ncbi:MAG: dephospho-CoA kinase [Nitrospirota bacterium]|nr:MAG: dephospho-CoA kinase [Nitrospirota bacterium]
MLIGLTGNFGTGKSTVLEMFASLGAVTIDSDEIVRSLYNLKEIQERIIEIFGSDILVGENIDKARISNIIFNNNELKLKLEALLHKYVFSEIEALSKENTDKIVIAEIPLLLETDNKNSVDAVITVFCNESTIYERLSADGFSEDDIRSRLANQMPLDEKKKQADFLIDTDMPIEDIRREVSFIFGILKRGFKD